MVKIKPTDKKIVNDGKGNEVIVDNNAPVREVWINSGGFFNNYPLETSVGIQPFRIPTAGRHELLDEAYRLWKFDPLGGTIVRTTSFFTLGRGLIYQFDDEAAQFYANKFYERNNLEIRLRAACDEANAFGEVYIWLRPKMSEERLGNKVLWRQGDTQVTFIPPHNITNIETANEDVGDVYNFIFEWSEGDRLDRQLTIPHISKYDIESATASNGCIIQLKMNAGNMDVFGHSDLIPIKEWLDNYQEYLRDGVVINKLYRSPCYDISIEDGSPDEVNAAIARYRGWSIGSNPVHNSREEWKVLEFKGGSGNEEARRALLLMIAAGVGFAEFMLADGSNSNLASSKTQQLPVIKKFEDRQEVWSHNLMMMFQFALQIKAIHGNVGDLTIERDRESDIVPFAGRVEFPAISQDKDLEVAQTNKLAIEGGYMSKRTAAARLNIDLDRQMQESMNDVPKAEQLQSMMVDAGLMLDPTEPSPSDKLKAEAASNAAEERESRSGQAEIRPRRDRSREDGGARST